MRVTVTSSPLRVEGGAGGGGSAQAPLQVVLSTTPSIPDGLCLWCFFATALASRQTRAAAVRIRSPFLIAPSSQSIDTRRPPAPTPALVPLADGAVDDAQMRDLSP